MGKFQLLIWFISGSRPSMTNGSGAKIALSLTTPSQAQPVRREVPKIKNTRQDSYIIGPLSTRKLTNLWRKQGVQDQALSWVYPAPLGLRCLPSPFPILLVLCKITAITVVGLIGAVVIWRSQHWVVYTVKETKCHSSKLPVLSYSKSLCPFQAPHSIILHSHTGCGAAESYLSVALCPLCQ